MQTRRDTLHTQSRTDRESATRYQEAGLLSPHPDLFRAYYKITTDNGPRNSIATMEMEDGRCEMNLTVKVVSVIAETTTKLRRSRQTEQLDSKILSSLKHEYFKTINSWCLYKCKSVLKTFNIKLIDWKRRGKNLYIILIWRSQVTDR